MDFAWTPGQVRLRDRFMHLGREMRERSKTGGEAFAFDDDARGRLATGDLWRLPISEEFGGSGGSWWDFTAAFEGLAEGSRSSSLLLSVIAQVTMIWALLRHGSKTQKERYLPRMIAGAPAAIAIADPMSGTDVRSIKTVLVPDGKEFVLHGSKWNIVHAPNVDLALVVARLETGGREDIALVLLERGTAGFDSGPSDRKFGNQACPTGPLTFVGIRLDVDALLGDPRGGFRNLIEITSLGRLYYALVATSILRPFLREVLAYARTRESFKSLLREHQYVQGRITEIKIGIERTRWLAYGALWQLLTEHEEAFMTCSICKVVGSEALIRGAEHLLRLYGSNGYHEGPITELVRDALGFCSVGGTEEMHRKNIFNQLERLARA
jgi:alkylation response protein AidB-like acyl-CoA dehydrogenase